MLEQDLASIMRFLTIHSGNPAPYYKNVPEQFCVDEGAVQLEIDWTARKPFLIESDKCAVRSIETAYSAAVRFCTVSYSNPAFAGQEPKGSK